MANRTRVRWQHLTPQGTEEMHEEAPEPTQYPSDGLPSKVCRFCRKTIVRVDENEGPEALKALLRF